MQETRYRIIRIDEEDYGCEERPDDYVPMVSVLVIGLDGGLFPPGMFCNEVDDGENDTKADLQGEWLEDYLDALEEMEE